MRAVNKESRGNDSPQASRPLWGPAALAWFESIFACSHRTVMKARPDFDLAFKRLRRSDLP